MAAMACPHCRGLMQYVPELSGQVVACAHCGQHLRMAVAEAAAGPAPTLPAPPPVPQPQHRPLIPLPPSEVGESPFAPQQPQPLIAKGVGFRPSALAPSLDAPAPPAEEPEGEAPPIKRRSKSMWLEMVKVVLGGAAGLGLGSLAIAYFNPAFFGGTKQPKPVAPTPLAQRALPPRVASNDGPPIEWSTTPAPAAVPAQTARRPRGNPSRMTISPGTPSQPTSGVPAVQPRLASIPSPRSPAPPPRKSDPFTALPASLSLPQLATTQPHPLGNLATGHDPIELHLKSAAADIPSNSAFFTEPADASKNAWNAYFSADVAAAQTHKLPMGVFSVGASELGFRWHEPLPDVALRQQFENCLLEAKAGDYSRTVSLRTPQRAPSVRLDLNKEKDLHEYSLANLPKSDQLLLEISECRNFPSDVSFQGGVQQASVGQEITLKFKNLPGAEIIIKFGRQADGDLTVLVAPQFREDKSAVFELTYERLEKTRLSTERLLVKTQQDLREQQQKYKAAQSALSSLSAQLRSANFSQRTVIQAQITGVAAQMKRAGTRVASLQKQLPALQVRSQAVPQVKQFLDALHQRGELRLQIFVPCGDQRILLVDTRQTAPQGAE